MSRRGAKWVSVFLISLFLVIGINSFSSAERRAMQISTKEFVQNQPIPTKFTCQGDDLNPSLMIENIPSNAKTLALIVDDPDAPGGMWVHWVVFNIPIVNEIFEDSIPGIQGSNDFGRLAYGGPCPPAGVHRYFFKIYALDAELNLKEGASKSALEKAMKPHILEEAQLIGTYIKF